MVMTFVACAGSAWPAWADCGKDRPVDMRPGGDRTTVEVCANVNDFANPALCAKMPDAPGCDIVVTDDQPFQAVDSVSIPEQMKVVDAWRKSGQ